MKSQNTQQQQQQQQRNTLEHVAERYSKIVIGDVDAKRSLGAYISKQSQKYPSLINDLAKAYPYIDTNDLLDWVDLAAGRIGEKWFGILGRPGKYIRKAIRFHTDPAALQKILEAGIVVMRVGMVKPITKPVAYATLQDLKRYIEVNDRNKTVHVLTAKEILRSAQLKVSSRKRIVKDRFLSSSKANNIAVIKDYVYRELTQEERQKLAVEILTNPSSRAAS